MADPSGSASLVAAAGWVRSLVTGTAATAVATIAVAAIGFLMLQGRLPLRRGVVVVFGCFVIFGASTIAAALLAVGQSMSQAPSVAVAPAIVPAPRPTAPPQPTVYDPYAGASVPVR